MKSTKTATQSRFQNLKFESMELDKIFDQLHGDESLQPFDLFSIKMKALEESNLGNNGSQNGLLVTGLGGSVSADLSSSENLRGKEHFFLFYHRQIQGLMLALHHQLVSVDSAKRGVLIEVARNNAQQLLSEYISPAAVISLEERISNFESKWAGALHVHFDSLNDYQREIISPVLQEHFLDVLQDAAVNAFRHGNARNLWVSARMHLNDAIHLQIRNDGLVDIPSRFGRGFQTFENVSQGKWQTSTENRQFMLSVWICE